MKCLLTVCLVTTSAFAAAAELLPSNSYLPPSATSRNPGYPQGPQSGPLFPGAPQVIAARNLELGVHEHRNGLSRSSSHDLAAQGVLGARGRQGYDEISALYRNNEIDANSEPANYNFGYMVADYEGSDFGHHEERLEEKAQGEYHVVLPDGRKQTVSYEADENGFKPQISYQNTDDLTRSGGYDANANTRGRSHGNGYNGGHDDDRGY